MFFLDYIRKVFICSYFLQVPQFERDWIPCVCKHDYASIGTSLAAQLYCYQELTVYGYVVACLYVDIIFSDDYC
jgi:hypothetical protein